MGGVVRSVDVASGKAVIEAKVAGNGPAVIMIAGLARGVSDLADLMHAIVGAGYQAVAINMRGAEGSSGPFANLTTDMMVGDIEAVARALGLGRFHILGHALGGRLARYFAACHPDMVKTVIALAGSGRQIVPVDYRPLGEAVMRTLAGTISADEMDRVMLECGLVAPANSPRPCRSGWWSNAQALMEAWNQRPIDDYLKAGRRPFLLLYGAEDGINPLAKVFSLREELGDQVHLVEIAGAGHCMQVERPREVEAAILDWLSGNQDS